MHLYKNEIDILKVKLKERIDILNDLLENENNKDIYFEINDNEIRIAINDIKTVLGEFLKFK